MLKNQNLFQHKEDDMTGEAVTRADSISYLPLDEAMAVARPNTIGCGWHEMEFDALASEQVPLWAASGEKLSRPFAEVAARWRARHESATHEIGIQKDELAKAKESLDLHNEALQGFTRREPHAKVMYMLRWALLLLGDIAGIAGAAILLGDIPALAVMQAVASAIAAVAAGLAGNDIRDSRLARRRMRERKDLADENAKFAWVFSGPDAGESIVKAMILVAITITLLIFGGIFALRSGVDGTLSGVVFGCLACAICLASALNTYQYADEVADLLDRADNLYTRALKRLEKLSTNPALAEYGAAEATANSIKTEHEKRGIAGELKIKALKFGVSRQNPAVMGHGPAAASRTTEPDLFSELELGLDGAQP